MILLRYWDLEWIGDWFEPGLPIVYREMHWGRFDACV